MGHRLRTIISVNPTTDGPITWEFSCQHPCDDAVLVETAVQIRRTIEAVLKRRGWTECPCLCGAWLYHADPADQCFICDDAQRSAIEAQSGKELSKLEKAKLEKESKDGYVQKTLF